MIHGMRSTSLRKLRREREITQAALADSAGISQAAIAAIEKGDQVPKLDTALRIAGALGLSVEALFPELVPHAVTAPATEVAS